MATTIRPATGNDHVAISRIAAELATMHLAALPDRFRHADDPLPLDYVQALIASTEDHVIVAETGNQVVGYAILRLRESPPVPVVAPRRYVLLNDLAVATNVHGRGIGRQLIDAAREWAREQGAVDLELSVYEFNEAAVAFYEHLGFRTIRRSMALPIDPE